MSAGRYGGPVKPSKTCDVCKLRHQKCDSSRPSCQYCALRDFECVYSKTPAHQLTGLSVQRRSRNTQPSSTESADEGLAWMSAVKRRGSIFSGEGNQLRPWTERRKPSRPPSEDEIRAAGSSNSSPASPFKASLQHFVAVLGRNLLGGDGSELSRSLTVSSGHTEEADRSRQWRGRGTRTINPFDRNALPPMAQLQLLLDSFLEGPNKIIFVCDPLESRNQLDDLYYRTNDISHASLSLIFLQLSIGAQNLGVVPHQTCSTFYETGRKALEIGIEISLVDWLWVVQAHVLDCIYSMNERPNMCWIVLGSAIRIAQTYHIDDNQNTSLFSKAEHSRWRQVWLGMVFLDAWLAAALGRLPQINKNTTRDPFLQNVYLDVGMPTHLVQTNLARIAVIKGAILQDIYVPNSVSIPTYKRYVTELEKWLFALPQTLRPHTDNTGSDSRPKKSRGDMVATYILELAYLDSMLLLTRPLLLESTFDLREENPSVTQLSIRLYAQTCVDTADQISYLCSLMKSQRLLAKKSWTIIYANLHAALVIFTSLSQKESAARYNLTGAQLKSRRQMDHDGLTGCLSILAYCATEDQLAKQYLSIVKVFQSAMSAIDVTLHPETKQEALPTPSDSETVGPSPQDYNCSPTLWSTLPALINTSTSQTSISTSVSYEDPDEAQVQSNVFGGMQDWFIGPTLPNVNTSNSYNTSASNSAWSTSPYEPDLRIPSYQYAPTFAGYTPADSCGMQQLFHTDALELTSDANSDQPCPSASPSFNSHMLHIVKTAI